MRRGVAVNIVWFLAYARGRRQAGFWQSEWTTPVHTCLPPPSRLDHDPYKDHPHLPFAPMLENRDQILKKLSIFEGVRRGYIWSRSIGCFLQYTREGGGVRSGSRMLDNRLPYRPASLSLEGSGDPSNVHPHLYILETIYS